MIKYWLNLYPYALYYYFFFWHEYSFVFLSCLHRCQCLPGFTGLSCGQPCPLGRFGQDCVQVCDCNDGGGCDRVSGECTCAPGWRGPQCKLRKYCKGLTFQKYLILLTLPMFDGNAPSITICYSVSDDRVLFTACEAGRYGAGCAMNCSCANEGECDHISGACMCQPGKSSIVHPRRTHTFRTVMIQGLFKLINHFCFPRVARDILLQAVPRRILGHGVSLSV